MKAADPIRQKLFFSESNMIVVLLELLALFLCRGSGDCESKESVMLLLVNQYG
jgi:hypothetical protein